MQVKFDILPRKKKDTFYLFETSKNHLMRNNLFFFLFFLFTSLLSAQMPDTTGHRHATSADAAYWHNVNEGDYLFFDGNAAGGNAIYAGGTALNISVALGKKILIWRGDYHFIHIDGKHSFNSESQPTVITNFGGQVRWGYYESTTSTRRSLEVINFDYVEVTGKYDPANQTGHVGFQGHKDGADYDQPDYYMKYGMWGHPRWSGIRFKGSYGNIVRIFHFKHLKVSYVASTEGGFAGFNIKSDNPSDPERVKVDVQDCFAGWTEGEGYYIGYSTNASNNDLIELTLRNNIAVFNGAEAYQTDNLAENSVLENNVALASGSFYRTPFMGSSQDGLHQFSFVEGGIKVQNNIMTGGDIMHTIRHKDAGAGRAYPSADKKVTFENNFYGYSRANVSYIWQGDGITPYEVKNSFYAKIPTVFSSDAYNGTGSQFMGGFFRFCNNNSPTAFSDLVLSEGRPLYEEICGNAIVTSNNILREEPALLSFVNLGFPDDVDFRDFAFWSDKYMNTDKDGELIPYKVGEYVHYYDGNGLTYFYKCIQEHSGNFDPNSNSDKWEKMDWDGNRLPPLDLRQKEGTFYAVRNIGLAYPDYSSIRWTGSVDQDWENIQNWSPEILPGEDDTVVIPNVVNDPVISDHNVIDNISIEFGASLMIDPGASLKVGGRIQEGGSQLLLIDDIGN